MLSPNTSPLRSALSSYKAHPALLKPCTAATASISTKRHFHSTKHTNYRPKSLHGISHSTATTPSTSIRRITQSASPPTPTPPTSPESTTTHTTPTPSSPTPLTWSAYLPLRRTRRRYNLVSSLTSSLATTAGGISYLAQQPLESIGLFGLDPILVLGITVLGSGGVGWLVGPFVGEMVFGWRYRRVRAQMAEKEKDLFARIKRHRVDPSGGGAANPVPDYYGEKIDSVRSYRNWMKDQRAFNKKRQNFV